MPERNSISGMVGLVHRPLDKKLLVIHAGLWMVKFLLPLRYYLMI